MTYKTKRTLCLAAAASASKRAMMPMPKMTGSRSCTSTE